MVSSGTVCNRNIFHVLSFLFSSKLPGFLCHLWFLGEIQFWGAARISRLILRRRHGGHRELGTIEDSQHLKWKVCNRICSWSLVHPVFRNARGPWCTLYLEIILALTWQSSDMSSEHTASLLEQPDTQLVPRHGRLGDPPGQGGKVRLAETVVTVGQQTKPRKTKNLNCTSRNVFIFTCLWYWND